jgi:protein tyrosine/serine phosphatase
LAEILALNRRSLVLSGLALVLASSVALARNGKWAKPIELVGVPNLNVVSPDFYRSAQPTAEGFVAAKRSLKIATVVNLRESQTDAELLKGVQVDEQSVPMNAFYITNKQVIAALRLIKAGLARGPVLLHCKHGADRTGVVVAMYRILYQDWTKEQALDEMQNGGFNFHSIFVNIPAFVRNADIPYFKRALAITP